MGEELTGRIRRYVEEQSEKAGRRFPDFLRVERNHIYISKVLRPPEEREIRGQKRLLMEIEMGNRSYTLDCSAVVLQDKVRQLMKEGKLTPGGTFWFTNTGPVRGSRWHQWYVGVEA